MPLSIIFAGYPRTGTTSLRQALSWLGFGPCHGVEHATATPLAMRRWMRALAGESIDWGEVFDGFGSSVDFPSFLFYKELAEYYPSAKVILSVREPDALFQSTQAILSAEQVAIYKEFPTWPLWSKCLAMAYGDRMDDRDGFVAHYERHNARVRSLIASNRLLVYEAKSGWSPLCEFLGISVPEVPFPSINQREHWPQPWQLRHLLESQYVGGWGSLGLAKNRDSRATD